MNDKKLIAPVALLLAGLLLAGAAPAQLRIEITSGVTDPIPVAIVPFVRSVPGDGGLDVAAIVQRDLEGTGRFRAMARADMIETPSRAAEVVVADWRTARNDYIVVGRVLPGAAGAASWWTPRCTSCSRSRISVVDGRRPNRIFLKALPP